MTGVMREVRCTWPRWTPTSPRVERAEERPAVIVRRSSTGEAIEVQLALFAPHAG